MTGKILGFDLKNQDGVIAGDDGKRYKYSQAVWKDSVSPKKVKRKNTGAQEEDCTLLRDSS